MAKKAYIGVNNVARKIKKMYIGVNGVARKIKKAYIGVNGVARLFFNYMGEVKKRATNLSLSVGRSDLSAISIGNYALFAGGAQRS